MRNTFSLDSLDAQRSRSQCGSDMFASGAPGDGVVVLSYWTYPTHRNRGIASRAVAIAVKLAFTDLKKARLEVVVDPDNHYSRKVALNNGFEESGTRGKQILYVLDNPSGAAGLSSD